MLNPLDRRASSVLISAASLCSFIRLSLPYFVLQNMRICYYSAQYDDLIAETVLDLGLYFRRAYKRNAPVKLFEKKDKKKGGGKAKRTPSQKESGARRVTA